MFVILLYFLLFEISVFVSFLSPRPVNPFLKLFPFTIVPSTCFAGFILFV